MFSNPSPKAGNSALFIPNCLSVAYFSTFQARKARKHLAGWNLHRGGATDRAYIRDHAIPTDHSKKRAEREDMTALSSPSTTVKEGDALPDSNIHLRGEEKCHVLDEKDSQGSGQHSVMEHILSDFVNSRHLRHHSSGSYPFYGAFTAASGGFSTRKYSFGLVPDWVK